MAEFRVVGGRAGELSAPPYHAFCHVKTLGVYKFDEIAIEETRDKTLKLKDAVAAFKAEIPDWREFKYEDEDGQFSSKGTGWIKIKKAPFEDTWTCFDIVVTSQGENRYRFDSLALPWFWLELEEVTE